MKKKILLIFLAFVMSFTLFSCKDEPEFAPEEDIWNGTFVESNIFDRIPQEVEELGVQKYLDDVYFDEDVEVDETYAHLGLLIITNEANQVGFYSLQYQKYLIAPRYQAEWLVTDNYNYNFDLVQVNGVEDINFVINIYYEDVWESYDSFGNLIFTGDTEPRFETTVVNKKIYLTVSDYENYDISYYEYTSDLKLNEVAFIPKPKDDDINTPEYDDNMNVGDKFVVNKIELDEFGLEGKYLLVGDNNSLMTMFDESNKKVNTFTVPENVDIVSIIGKNIVYSLTTVLPSENETYDFIYDGFKCFQEIYSINLEDGTKTKVKTNYAILGPLLPYSDGEGVYNYALGTVGKINEDKCITTVENYIINSDCELVQALTGYEPFSFEKIGENYYNRVTCVIYNNQLEELAYIGDMDPELMEKEGFFVGSIIDNRGYEYYGIVDFNGNVLVPFEYTAFNYDNDFDMVDGYILAQKEDKEGNVYYYRVNTNNASSEFLGTDVHKIYKGLYVVDTDDSYIFTSPKEVLYKYEKNENSVQTSYELSTIVNENLGFAYVYATVFDYYLDNNGGYVVPKVHTEYVTFVIDDCGNATTFNTIGTEVTNSNNLGLHVSDAIELSSGNNALHFTQENLIHYFTIVAPETGYYAIVSDEMFVIDSVKDYYGEDTMYSIFEDEELDLEGYVVYLEKDVEYCLEMYVNNTYNSVPDYLYLEVEIYDTLGMVVDNPYMVNVNEELTLEFNGREKLFVMFEPIQAFSSDYSEHFIYDIALSAGSYNFVGLELNDVYYSNNDMYEYVVIQVNKPEDADAATIKIVPNLGETPVDGGSIYNPIKLGTEPAEGMTFDNSFELNNSNNKFAMYVNETEEIQIVSMTFYPLESTSAQYIIFDLFGDFVETFTANSAYEYQYVLTPGEAVYIASISSGQDACETAINVNVTQVPFVEETANILTETADVAYFAYVAPRSGYVDISFVDDNTTISNFTLIGGGNYTGITGLYENYFMDEDEIYIYSITPLTEAGLNCVVKVSYNDVLVTNSFTDSYLEHNQDVYYRISNDTHLPKYYTIDYTGLQTLRVYDEYYMDYTYISNDRLVVEPNSTVVLYVKADSYSSEHSITANREISLSTSNVSVYMESYEERYFKFVAPSDGKYVIYTENACTNLQFEIVEINSGFGIVRNGYFATAELPEGLEYESVFDVAYSVELNAGDILIFTVYSNYMYEQESFYINAIISQE